MQRGPLFQLLVVAGVIAGVSLLGGLAVLLFGPFTDAPTAVWWAFLRLTDPGYLGDDEGALVRTVSTVLTVVGFVLFVGLLIAILTQALQGTVRRLESGLTPVPFRGHIVILGWTNRTPSIVREIMLSQGRVRRFLKRHGVRRLRVVVLADVVTAARVHDLRAMLGPAYDEGAIFLRSGSSLRAEHLARVAVDEASVVILPGADFSLGGPDATDARVVKTLMSMAAREQRGETGTPVVAEVYDTRKAPIARGTYGPEAEIVAGDAFISRLIVQNVRQRGLSYVYADLLSYGHGHQIYVRAYPELAGQTVGALYASFTQAVVLGIVRTVGGEHRALLNPDPNLVLVAADRLVLLAEDYDQTTLTRRGRSTPPPVPAPTRPRRVPPERGRRLLLLGWSHKVAALLREFEALDAVAAVDVMSVVPADERIHALARTLPSTTRLAVRHTEGDYTLDSELRAMDPAGYDHIVLLSSDWLATGEESDARTVLGYALLQTMLGAARPSILVELMDAENAYLFQQRAGEVIISPQVLSHILAHVALRRELNAVFKELFRPGGCEVTFLPATTYGLSGEVDWKTTAEAIRAAGDVPLGIRPAARRDDPDGGIRLLPPGATPFTLVPDDDCIVLRGRSPS